MQALLRRPVILLLAIWGGLMLSTLAWIVATPLGGSPDEPAHLIRAASVARGELLGEPTEAPAVRSVTVPVGIATAGEWPCYAFRPDVPASCTRAIPNGLELTTTQTSAGLYNPTYYALVGWPSVFIEDTAMSVFAMRAISALLCTFFFAAGVVALRQLYRSRALMVGLAAALTPMVLFLAAAVNPNALEVATGFALLSSLLLLLGRTPLPNRLPWLLVVGASGVILAQTRGLSPLWMAMIAAIALVMTPWSRTMRELRRPGVMVTVGVLGAAVLAAVGWILFTGTLGSMGNFPGATDSPARAFLNMILRAFDPGLIGIFGWLDSPSPLFVQSLWSFLAFAVGVAGLAVARGREVWAMLIAIAGLFLVPPTVQALSVQSSGYIWQGRYALVAYACLMVLAAVLVAARISEARRDGRWAVMVEPRPTAYRLGVILTVLVLIGHVWALAGALQRYQGGLPIERVLIAPLWSPPGGSALWLSVLALGVVFTSVVGYAAFRPAIVPVETAERPEESEADAPSAVNAAGATTID